MKFLLATGIYPPEIGGIATYTQQLARAFTEAGVEVVVIAYGEDGKQKTENGFHVFRISRSGGPITRWRRYAKALQQHGEDADVVIAFSAVSAGVPLWISRLKGPKKILRLGGDFLWERYTDRVASRQADRGGMLSLRDYYASTPKFRWLMQKLLHIFDHIVFSTAFQQKIYQAHYRALPSNSVIQNAIPLGTLIHHKAHDPFMLLFIGRLVACKNITALLRALALVPNVHLTMVGSGPLQDTIMREANTLAVHNRVRFFSPVQKEQTIHFFKMSDALILPSFSEVSPNIALEARAHGLPVLLTQENGLDASMTQGMILCDLRSPRAIADSIMQTIQQYNSLATEASTEPVQRDWNTLAQEWIAICMQ